MKTHLFLAVLLFAFVSVHAALPNIVSIYYDGSTAPEVVSYDAHNASIAYVKSPFPLSLAPSVRAGALDAVGHRYFVSTARDMVLVFNAVTLEKIAALTLPFREYLPSSMVYDAKQDLLWVVYQFNLDHGGSATQVCSMSATRQTDLQCYTDPSWVKLPAVVDGAAFDASSNNLWITASTGNSSYALLGFNVVTHVPTGAPVIMPSSCSQMQMVTVNGSTSLACYTAGYGFVGGGVSLVNTQTGAFTLVALLDPLSSSSPVRFSSVACLYPAQQTSSFVFVQSGSFTNAWLEVDMKSGKTLTSLALDTSMMLSSSVCVQQ